ncbi:MAG TPA: acetylornithine transaminase [Nitrospirota bacterium]|jgi:predicted acetylornithine/succinylornithine family transaminase
MSTDKTIEESKKYLMNTYNRYPVVFVRGKGMKLWDSDGKEYTDFLAGIAVNNLGHCHPRVVIALQKQAQKLIHVSNIFHIEPQVKLAKLLVQNSFADKVFFCNSGAEANEAAIKLARKYAKEKMGEGRYEIITATQSFHGRTMATITATGQEKFRKAFTPLLPGFKYVPFGDIDAISAAIDDKTCAVMLEPVQAEGGINIPPDNYFHDLRALLDEKGILLILDEVQTGMGRTGKLFGYEHFGIEPDIMTLAKALGGGTAIGAMLATAKVAESFVPGDHASTFGGNPLACAGGVATVEAILEDGWLLGECVRVGEYFMKGLEKLKQRHEEIKAVRGMGLLIGMEMGFDAADIVKEALKEGYIINCTSGNVLRFVPPLIVTQEDIDGLLDALDRILERRKAQ